MSDVKWIKMATDLFDNRKIKQIESLPDGDAIIVIWVKILCLAGSINDDGFVYFTKEIPYTEQMLSTQFNRPIATIQLALRTFEQFGMLEIIDDMLHISNWEKYQNVEGMEKIREQTRARVAKHREKLKQLECSVTSNVTVTQSNALDKNRLDKKEIREEKNINTRAQDDINIYGEYKNVKLTDAEYNRLVTEYTEETVTKAIKYLDEYIEDKGYKVKAATHNLSIRRWVIDAVKEKEQKKPKQTKADELNDAYQMLADWSENG